MANVLDATLYKATLHNDIKAVEDALNKGANPNANDFNWNQSTALIEACKNGNKDICLLLISKGAQIGLMDKYDNHPIHYACLNGHSDIAEILVKKGANVNIIGYYGHTPLHYACSKKRGNRKVIRKLISMGADVNRMGHDGWTPLMVLAENCLTGTMKELIDAGADKTIGNKKNDPEGILLSAVRNNDIKAVEDALNKGANPNANDFNWNHSTALIEACKNGNKDICLLLISKGAQIDLKDKYQNHSIHYACLNGHSDIAEILVQNGADVNEIGHCGHTPLHYACSKKRGNRKVIRKLISMEADVNRMDSSGWTPLMVLAENCLTGTMKELIDAGADKSIRNNKGNTAKDILRAYCPDKVDDFEKYISKKNRAIIRARKKTLKREDSVKIGRNVPDFDI